MKKTESIATEKNTGNYNSIRTLGIDKPDQCASNTLTENNRNTLKEDKNVFNEKLKSSVDKCMNLIERAKAQRHLEHFMKEVYFGDQIEKSASATKLDEQTSILQPEKDTNDKGEANQPSCEKLEDEKKLNTLAQCRSFFNNAYDVAKYERIYGRKLSTTSDGRTVDQKAGNKINEEESQYTVKVDMDANEGMPTLIREDLASNVNGMENGILLPDINQTTMNFNEYILERCNSLISSQSQNSAESLSPKKSKSKSRKFSRKHAILDEKFKTRKKKDEKAGTQKSIDCSTSINQPAGQECASSSPSHVNGTSHVLKTLPNSEIKLPVVDTTAKNLSSSSTSEIDVNALLDKYIEQDAKRLYESFVMQYSLRSWCRYNDETNQSSVGLIIFPCMRSFSQSHKPNDLIFYANDYERNYEIKLLNWLSSTNPSDDFNPYVMNDTLPNIVNRHTNETGYRVVKNEYEAIELVGKLEEEFKKVLSDSQVLFQEKVEILKREKRAITPKSLSKVRLRTKDLINIKQKVFETDLTIRKYQDLLNTWNLFNGTLVSDQLMDQIRSHFPQKNWQKNIHTEQWCSDFYGDIETVEQASKYSNEYTTNNLEWIPRYRRLFLAVRAIHSILDRTDLPNGIERSVLIRKIVIHFFYTFEGMNLLYMEQEALKNKCFVLEARMDKWRRDQVTKS